MFGYGTVNVHHFKLYYVKLCNVYYPPNIIIMIKSRMVRLAQHIVGMRRRGNEVGFLWEGQKEGDHRGEPDLGGRIILKLVL
jgi:hypothetical protein